MLNDHGEWLTAYLLSSCHLSNYVDQANTRDTSEWQEAFIRVWSDQAELLFVKHGNTLVAANTCALINQTALSIMNRVDYTEQDLTANLLKVARQRSGASYPTSS